MTEAEKALLELSMRRFERDDFEFSEFEQLRAEVVRERMPADIKAVWQKAYKAVVYARSALTKAEAELKAIELPPAFDFSAWRQEVRAEVLKERSLDDPLDV